jgi:acetyltransferase-like isoleucine patch superfamily enzyme
MTLRVPHPLIDPLLRTLMGLPPSLVRFAPNSAKLPLETRYLRDSPLVAGLGAEWDDTCFITAPQGGHDKLGHIKLALGNKAAPQSDIHLTILNTAGQLQLLIGGAQVRLFIGAGCVLNGSLHLSSKPSCFIGDDTTMHQTRLIVANGDLAIGADCQFSEEAQVLCHQQHLIVEEATQEILAPGRAKVSLGRHVWVGRRALVLPGAKVGEGAVIDAGLVLSGEVAANTWVRAGQQEVQREGVTWLRSAQALRQNG